MASRSTILGEILSAAGCRSQPELTVWLERELEQARRWERNADPIRVGRLTLDQYSTAARTPGRAVKLRPAEARALALLMRHHGYPVQRGALLGDIAVNANVSGKLVDVTVSHLRRKLREIGFDNAIITIQGIGYMLWVSVAQGGS
jgi:DNA-binding response OmpR family regulator